MDISWKIKKVSAFLQYACYLVIAIWLLVIPITVFNIWFRPDALSDYLSDQLLPTLYRMREADLLRSIPAVVIYFAPSALGLYGVWRFSRLFGLYRMGIYFSDTNSNHLFVGALAGLLVHLLQTVFMGIADYVLTIGSPLTAYGMPININGDEISNFITASAFLVIAWVMREAVKIANENAEFV